MQHKSAHGHQRLRAYRMIITTAATACIIRLIVETIITSHTGIPHCIGVGAGKFLGVRRIFARISPNCPKDFWATFCVNIFSWRPYWAPFPSSNQSTLGAIFFKSKDAGRHFCSYVQEVCPDFQRFCEGFHRFCPDFSGFCPDFQGFCPDFHQIKTFGGALAPPATPPPTPLAHCVERSAHGTPHHGFNLLISVECACVEHYPWVYSTQYDVWRALPSK